MRGDWNVRQLETPFVAPEFSFTKLTSSNAMRTPSECTVVRTSKLRRRPRGEKIPPEALRRPFFHWRVSEGRRPTTTVNGGKGVNGRYRPAAARLQEALNAMVCESHPSFERGLMSSIYVGLATIEVEDQKCSRVLSQPPKAPENRSLLSTRTQYPYLMHCSGTVRCPK